MNKQATIAKLFAWASPVAVLAASSSGRADFTDATLGFALRIQPAQPSLDSLHLAHFPRFIVTTTPALSTPDDVGQQLVAAVAAEAAARELPSFDSVARYQDFTLVVRSEPRVDNESLTAPFEDQLYACIRSVEAGRTSELNALWGVLHGGGTLGTFNARARQAGLLMAESYDADRCQTARNAEPIGDRMPMLAAVRGMLTEVWHPSYFSAYGDIRAVIDALSPLLFSTRGVWVNDRERAVRGLLRDVIEQRLIAEETYAQLSGMHFTTFVDFVTFVRRAQRGVGAPVFEAVARACLPDDEAALFQPFSFEACSLRAFHLRLGQASGVAIARRAQ